MSLVEHAVRPDVLRLAARGQVRLVHVGDDAFRHEGRRVALVEGEVVTRLHLVAEHGRIPGQVADVDAGVGVEQQLVRIEAVTLLRLVGPVDAEAVELSGLHVREIAVEHLIGIFGKLDPVRLLGAGRVEEAQLDLGGVGREQGEIGAPTVPERSARMRGAFERLPGIDRLVHVASLGSVERLPWLSFRRPIAIERSKSDLVPWCVAATSTRCDAASGGGRAVTVEGRPW